MSDTKTPAELWEQMKTTFEDLGKDVAKNLEKHNVSAGVRVRKGVRSLRAAAAAFLKATVEADKATRESRKSKTAESETPAS